MLDARRPKDGQVILWKRIARKRTTIGKKLPESVGKAEALAGLEKATRNCRTKGRYSKGEHSFELLAMIDSRKVVATCPWAARFIEMLEEKMRD